MAENGRNDRTGLDHALCNGQVTDSENAKSLLALKWLANLGIQIK